MKKGMISQFLVVFLLVGMVFQPFHAANEATSSWHKVHKSRYVAVGAFTAAGFALAGVLYCRLKKGCKERVDVGGHQSELFQKMLNRGHAWDTYRRLISHNRALLHDNNHDDRVIGTPRNSNNSQREGEDFHEKTASNAQVSLTRLNEQGSPSSVEKHENGRTTVGQDAIPTKATNACDTPVEQWSSNEINDLAGQLAALKLEYDRVLLPLLNEIEQFSAVKDDDLQAFVEDINRLPVNQQIIFDVITRDNTVNKKEIWTNKLTTITNLYNTQLAHVRGVIKERDHQPESKSTQKVSAVHGSVLGVKGSVSQFAGCTSMSYGLDASQLGSLKTSSLNYISLLAPKTEVGVFLEMLKKPDSDFSKVNLSEDDIRDYRDPKTGNTLLMVAIESKNENCIMHLCLPSIFAQKDCGKIWSVQNNNGDTALMVALKELRNTSTFTSLLIFVDSRSLTLANKQGDNILHLAANGSDEDAIKSVLVSIEREGNEIKRSLLLHTNKDGKTPLDIATEKQLTKSMAILEAAMQSVGWVKNEEEKPVF